MEILAGNMVCFLCMSMTLLLAVITTAMEETDRQRSLDDHFDFINHFSEMLRRKSDDYSAKRDEYRNWLVNYRETEREDVQARSETEDNQLELSHEQSEVEGEQHHEHVHDIERHHTDRIQHLVKRNKVQNIIQPEKEAKQFLKSRSYNTRK